MHDGATCEEPEPTSLYRIGGLHVSSIEAPDDPLFEQVHSDAPDIVIRRGRREDADLAWHAAADPVRYGDVLVAASPEGGYVVKYPEWFVAVVGPQGREIVVFEEDRWSGLSRSLFATVVPLALAATGRVAFHASAVDVDGAAVVIVGEGGAGKSTLATALCLEGGRLIADDITYVRL
ncbi:MAG TPA: hypothetical protein VNT52_05385, partial [Acidimicrobiales bacterium]|nr:hypothetical protein [Acidimicrobiales bacterium]